MKIKAPPIRNLRKRSSKKSSQQRLFAAAPQKPLKLLAMLAVVMGVFGSIFWFYQSRALGDAKLVLSSPSGMVAPGATVTLDLMVEAGLDSVNVVQANLAYPVDKLEYIGVDVTGSAFPNSAQSTGGNGMVMIGRYSSPGESVTGTQLVAKVAFKALASTGSTNVSIIEGSMVVRAVDSIDVLGGSTAGTIAFGTATPTPTPTPPPSLSVAGLSLTPTNANVVMGEDVTLDIQVDTGADSVNVVQANLAYPADKLEFVGTDSSSSAFPNSAQSTGGNGMVMIGRYSSPGESVTGNLTVARVTFKALASMGTAEIGIVEGSQVVRASDSVDILSTRTGATISLLAPLPPSGVTVPTVTVLTPQNGATVTKNTQIKATAADTNRITKMEVYIDGRLHSTVTNTINLASKWNANKASRGQHVITVKAYNNLGGVGESSVTVNKN